MKTIISLLLITLSACGGTQEADDGIPAVCHNYTARQYKLGEATCTPASSDTCAFGAHNQLVKLDQSEEPLAYYCTCEGSGTYSCWGSPSFVVADPLPAE